MCVRGVRVGVRFIANSLVKQVTKCSKKETSEIIWSNPLIFQKPRNLGTVPHEI